MARTKRQKLEAKARAKAAQPEPTQTPVMRPPVHTQPKVCAIRPTPERMARGAVKLPKGRGSQSMPAVDEAHDIIAAMHRARLLTDTQEQAARDWQALKMAVRAELGINQGRSCLDISPAGHDDTDGNPEVMQRWREVEERLGWVKTGALDWTVIFGRKPGNLALLQDALDALAGC